METYQKGDPMNGGEKDFPALFGFDSFGPSTFYRPFVWNGADHAAAGLLGFQAPAADGLDEDEAFTPFPRAPVLALQASQRAVSSTVGGKTKGKKVAKAFPRLPVEIHLQILSHLLDAPQTARCSFCHLFQLSTLGKVSRLYHSLLQPYLYSTLNLNFDSSLNSRSRKHNLCDAHFRLGSKHQQLELRVPLLLRTLSARPDLARGVRRLILPTGGLETYLTCALEKTHLPSLINKCQYLEDIHGAENLLCRQFSGEHYCLDGIEPQQHGILSKALHEKKSWKRWCWNGGNAAGCDFWHRLWDSHPDMERIGFVELHQNWSQLEHLEFRNVWNVDANMVKSIITKLPSLQRLALVGVRKKRLGRGDISTALATLNILPASVKHIELGDVPEDTFLTAVGEWVRLRHTINESSILESLGLTRTLITALNLRAFLSAISVNRVKGWPCARKYRNLLDFTPRWWSLVRRLSLDNSGFESAFCPLDTEIGFENMDLRGLEELDWRVRSEGGNENLYLGQRLQFGWFRDMKMLEGVDREDDCVRTAAKARNIEVL